MNEKKMDEANKLLENFLKKRSTSDCKLYTHTSMNGGKYKIDDDELDEFYNIYSDVLDYQSTLGIVSIPSLRLTERFRDFSPVRIDLDFRYNCNHNESLYRKHNYSHIENFIKYYMIEVDKWLSLSETDRLCFVTEKSGAVPHHPRNGKCEPDEDGNIPIKDGVHLMFPYLLVQTELQLKFRESVLKYMKDIFEDMNMTTSYGNVIDRAVIDKNNWMLYGSSKRGSTSYKLTKIYRAETDNLIELEESFINSLSDNQLVKLLSVRAQTVINLNGEEVDDDCKINRIISQIRIEKQAEMEKELDEYKIKAKKISAPKGLKKSKPKPKNLSPDHFNIVQKLVDALSPERADNYDSWIRVGWTLHNIDKRLLPDWIKFSKKINKYNSTADEECRKVWEDMYDEGYTEKSLRYWVKEDNPKAYKDIQREEAYEQMIESIENNLDTGDDKLNATLKEMKIQPYDVAKVLHTISKGEFVCVDPSRSKFGQYYYFVDHRWEKSMGDILLRERVSEDIPKAYYDLIKDYVSKSKSLDSQANKYSELVDNWKENCKGKFTKMMDSLKNTGFKDNVMKEATVMFCDKETKKDRKFLYRLDNNRNLVGFENGVYDLIKDEFRDGRPEDYISISTHIDYNEDLSWEDEEVQEVMQFVSEVLPDEDEREYILILLASFLNGNIKSEHFYIWTGSGGNGKSKLIELYNKTLGDYACTLPISLITKARKGSGEANPEVAMTQGKRFAVLQEPDAQSKINVGLMKEYTGGDTIMARQLYCAPVEFKPQFKMVLTCNQVPELPYEDEAVWRRVRCVEFKSRFMSEETYNSEMAKMNDDDPRRKYYFKANGDLSEKFDPSTSGWTSAFAWILIKYYDKWRLQGLKEPHSVIAVTQFYREKNDKFSDFFENYIIKDNTVTEPLNIKEVWNVFKLVAADTNTIVSPKIKKELQKYLEKKIGQVHSIGKQVAGWSGYRVKPFHEDCLSIGDDDNADLDP